MESFRAFLSDVVVVVVVPYEMFNLFSSILLFLMRGFCHLRYRGSDNFLKNVFSLKENMKILDAMSRCFEVCTNS